jgi:hypothetical protein
MENTSMFTNRLWKVLTTPIIFPECFQPRSHICRTPIMLPPHIAEHYPRDLESGCVDSVLALARRMFGIGPSASDDAFDVGFSVPHQRKLVYQHEGTRATRLHIARRTNKVLRRGSNLYIFHLHLLSLE